MAPKKKAEKRKQDTDGDVETPANAAKAEKAEKKAPKKKAEKAEKHTQDTDGDVETPVKAAKMPRRAASAKWDKNTPHPRSATPKSPINDSSRVLRLLTLNVAGLRSVLNGEKAEILRALVEREAPDILCLNEHKLKEDDVEQCEAKLKELLPKEYATFHWNCSTAKKGYSGVAVLLRDSAAAAEDGSKKTVIADPAKVTVTRGMGDLGKGDPIIDEEGRLLTVELAELTIVAVYVPNSGMELGRLAYRTDTSAERCWDRTIAKYVQELRTRRGLPVVVIGDLNCCHRVQDVWNMSERPDFPDDLAAKAIPDQYIGLSPLKKFAGITPEERASFGKLLEDGGLIDTFRALYPDASGVFSYFSQRVVQNRPLNRGLRLDYVLATTDLCDGLRPRTAKAETKDVDGAAAATGEDAAAEAPRKAEELRLPRVHESFILDQDDLVADHAAVGCHIVLPPLP